MKKKKEKEMELLQCPFCGSEAYVGIENMSSYWTIGCRAPDCHCNFTRQFATKEDAIRFWNIRPNIATDDMVFVLPKEDVEKFQKWKKKQEKKDPTTCGAVGGRWIFSFAPTGIGIIIKVKDFALDDELDLTDTDSW